MSDVTRILTAIEQGDAQAADKLLRLVYDQLRKLAPLRSGQGRGQPSPHLDSRPFRHHDAFMRTTVTLDSDVARLLRDAMHRSRRGFKETLNTALRNGLNRQTHPAKRVPFVVQPKPMGLRPGIDPASLNQMADELEADAFSSFSRKLRTRQAK